MKQPLPKAYPTIYNSLFSQTARPVLLLLLCFAISLGTARAQLTKVWEVPDIAYSAAENTGFVQQKVDPAGNLVLLGSNLALFKYDATGKQLWSAQHKSSPDINYLYSDGLWLDKSGNIFVLGRSGTAPDVYEDILLKYGPAGNLLWSKAFTNTPGNMVNVETLALDAEGNVYLTGNMNDAGITVMATQKLSGAGTVLWTTQEPGLRNGEVIEVDNKGGVFVLTSSLEVVLGSATILFYKYDATTGAKQLQKSFSTPRVPGYNETPEKLLITKAGEIYAIVGTSSGSSGVLKVFLHKLAADGTLLYKNQIGQTDAAVFYDAVFTANEELLFLCREQKYRTTWDHFMTKVDANGQHLWLHKFNVYEADNMVRYFAPAPMGMAMNADGTIAIAGSYSYFKIPPFSASTVYTEYPKYIVATFTKDGTETWRQLQNQFSLRDGRAGISYIDNKSLYVVVNPAESAGAFSTRNLTVMKFQDCAGFTANAGTDKTICAGGNAQLQATGGTNYSWSPSAGLSATNIANPVASPSQTTTYTVTVTNAEGCTATDQVVVTVNPMPAVTIAAGSATTFCAGGSVILTATSGTNYSYQWLKNGAPIAQATTKTYTATTSGDFTVIVKAAGGCEVTASPVKVVVTPGVTASAGTDKEICAGSNVQLGASGGTTYAWSPATGLSATNIANPVASPASTTTYTVTVSNASGCSSTDQVTVKVTASPAVTITPAGPTTFCEGGSLVLNASQGTGYTYQWYNNGNPINQATGSSFTTFAGGEFSVKVTMGSGCTATSSPVKVTENKAATVVAGTAQQVCVNAAAFTLSGFSPAGGTWSGPGVSANGKFNPATAGTGTHTLTYKVTQNSCEASATKTITVTSGVAAPGTITGNATTCAGTTNLTYSINAVTNAQNYTWTVPAGYTITDGQGTTSIKVTTGSTSGTITVKAANDCGESAAATIAVNITAQPVATITLQGASAFCEGEAALLKAPAGANYSYQWLRNGTTISGATAADYSATTSGNYTVQVSNGNCSRTSSQVSISVTPTIRNNAIASGNLSVCSGKAGVELQAGVPTGGAGTYTYQWEQSTDGTSYTNIPGATSQNYTPAGLTATTWFRRKVTSGGCSHTSASVKLTLAEAPVVSLSAFTKMCTGDAAMTLSGGLPAGGTYAGPGVTNGIFNAATAGAGTHIITYTYTDASGCAATASQTIVVETECAVTGVEDDEPPHKFEYFPNPAKDKLNIAVTLPEWTDLTIQLIDARGRIVLQKNYTMQVGTFAATILLEQKARGLYFLRVTTKEGSYHRKVLLW
ncbi:Ig-like domain-containing protein [Pontibacter fetidus]|uniref:T9SS type A sorting domain-containing protein n=1 Tax=Pontibacter fetidus TaxID=2700082 RepID=A0A6B2H4A1_9BACT|nr:T9SS type A sorting domain-containing protein [Pontibacter fetidus]NDK57213.1 T9SS type A sorting domain-containing protein [Pontibacter fetidus]